MGLRVSVSRLRVWVVGVRGYSLAFKGGQEVIPVIERRYTDNRLRALRPLSNYALVIPGPAMWFGVTCLLYPKLSAPNPLPEPENPGGLYRQKAQGRFRDNCFT